MATTGQPLRNAANPNASRARIKFDRQIVAIAKAEGAKTVWSDGVDVYGYAIMLRWIVLRLAPPLSYAFHSYAFHRGTA